MVLEYVLAWPQLSTLCLTLQAAKQITTKGASEKYIVREARTKKQEMELLEYGFEWVKDRGKTALYRKPAI